MWVVSVYRYIFCYTVPVSTPNLLDIFLCYFPNTRMEPDAYGVQAYCQVFRHPEDLQLRQNFKNGVKSFPSSQTAAILLLLIPGN
jgi:hypothetical protein